MASTWFVTQSGAGSANGTTLGNAWSAAAFNTSGNWSATAGAAGKISPGDTVSLNGTITSQLIVQGSGLTGNVITIQFASGAKLSTAAGFATGALQMSGLSFIVIDGQTTGIIECTANGTGLANQATATALQCSQCSNSTIQNLIVQNIYVRNSTTDLSTGSQNNGGIICDSLSGGGYTGLRITGCTVTHTLTGISQGYDGSSSTLEIDHNTITHCNWGIVVAARTAGATLAGALLHDNIINNAANWDDTTGADTFHHNFIFVFGETGAIPASGVRIYNNTLGPGYGGFATSALYLDGDATGIVYNNLFLGALNDSPSNGAFTLVDDGIKTGKVVRVYNNTFYNPSSNSGDAMVLESPTNNQTAITLENNIVFGWSTVANIEFSGNFSALVFDHNNYFGYTPSQAFSYSTSNSGNFQTLAQWLANTQAGSTFDPNSTTTTPNLNGSYIPQPASGAINNGLTISGSFMPAVDIYGTTRPQGAAWDIGAAEFISGAAVPFSGAFRSVGILPCGGFA